MRENLSPKGAGKDPNPNCLRCKGAGFYYDKIIVRYRETKEAFIPFHEEWARTCPCKTGVVYKSEKSIHAEENPPTTS